MRLHEIYSDPIRDAIKKSKTMDYDEFFTYADDEFNVLDATGNYSLVYQVPYNNMVMKLFVEDECYTLYAKFVYANRGNPHYPKISKIHYLRGQGNPGFVFIESLDHIDMHYSGEEYEMMRLMGKLFLHLSSIKRETESKEYHKEAAGSLIKALKKYLSGSDTSIYDLVLELEPVFRTLQEIKRAIPSKCLMDTHIKNFMIRPKTGEIVISDPVGIDTKY